MSSGTLVAGSAGTQAARAALDRAIIQTVAYADVFDYPLTAEEVHRYLVGVTASRGDVRNALASNRLPELSHIGRYFTLAGREATVETRRARAASAAEYW